MLETQHGIIHLLGRIFRDYFQQDHVISWLQTKLQLERLDESSRFFLWRLEDLQQSYKECNALLFGTALLLCAQIQTLHYLLQHCTEIITTWLWSVTKSKYGLERDGPSPFEACFLQSKNVTWWSFGTACVGFNRKCIPMSILQYTHAPARQSRSNIYTLHRGWNHIAQELPLQFPHMMHCEHPRATIVYVCLGTRRC